MFMLIFFWFKQLAKILEQLFFLAFIIFKFLIFNSPKKNIARSIMKSKLESVGAKVVSSVSSKTNYLICGENPGKNKTNKANELSVQLISESDVLDMIDN